MKLKGIVQGQTIRLLETIPDLDGVEVIIELPDTLLAKQSEKWEDLLTVLGAWKNDSEIESPPLAAGGGSSATLNIVCLKAKKAIVS